MSKKFSLILSVLAILLPRALFSQSFAISTNAVDYVELGTFNIEASYGLARHWSVLAGVKYNPFSFGKGESMFQYRQRLARAGMRWWPWHVYSGWWAGARAQWQEYSKGGFASPQTTEGDRFGGGVSAGYSYMLTPHLNLDVGLGVWAGWDKYRTYACPVCGTVKVSGGRYFVLPDDLILSLVYIF